MSDEDKGKPAKSVMGNLPSTRPTRMARRRDGDPVSGSAGAKPEPKPKAAPKRAPKPKAAAAKSSGAKPKAATAKSSGAKPKAVRSGSPSLDAAKKQPRAASKPAAPEPPKGTELVTTAVQATGELAKIGLTLGSQALKRAARRIPKP
jgi:hypothetical protein